ncbi:hypothetical protein [Brevundimonas vancanneytii]|uniref:hypothetical protein n=1 Tax=Brevundimonas vancanneytii TaxID=1325724 RepID=UPI0010FDE900|nr:hypothetical protein [Brevundimonas vancanneytii]
MDECPTPLPPIVRSLNPRSLRCSASPRTSFALGQKRPPDLDVSQGYLANLAMPDSEGIGSGPAYYRSTTSPTGGTAWYPTSEVEAFGRHRAAPIKRSYDRKSGQQDWTKLQDDVERLPVHTVVSMIEEWRDSELYRRAQAILYDPNPMAGRPAYEEECRLFGAAQKGGRVEAFAAIAASEDAAAQRKAIFESLDDQTNAVEAHLLALTASRGLSVSSGPSILLCSDDDVRTGMGRGSGGRNTLAELRLHGNAQAQAEHHQRDHDLRKCEKVIDLLILVGT